VRARERALERESSRARARERERERERKCERERESLLAPISLLLAVPPTQRLTTIEAKGREGGVFSGVCCWSYGFSVIS
jgi:hypothetical protein